MEILFDTHKGLPLLILLVVINGSQSLLQTLREKKLNLFSNSSGIFKSNTGTKFFKYIYFCL